ncbi:uncharacterized protein LOC129611327 isoform X2 [Condylostylus longicornis]|uniref:uncharacterized protein LOC129611327 isoform X2 n=1 Tax=Condylostylus longicornis TaxID=2530218 RepID=UPI00244E471B|nr:uncharacterized protein LOC129611327 isoform X2 [Condylostylus longicornis]
MTADLISDLKTLKDPLVKQSIKLKIVNEITNKLKNNKYSQNQIEDFLKPENVIDSCFFIKRLYVNFLIELKNDEVLIQSLLCENDDIIEDILKRCNYIWKNPKKQFNLQFLIQNVFPKISYSHRNKIIKLLAINTTNCDEAKKYFDELFSIYNISTARAFLKHCDLITWINMIKISVFLKNRDLEVILKERSRDIITYFENLLETFQDEELPKIFNHRDYNYSKIILKLYSSYPEEILKLIEKKFSIFRSFKASRKFTKSLIKHSADFVISDAESDRYNKFVLLKYFKKEEMEKYLCELFPEEKDITDIPSISYKKCYKRVYGKELLENNKNITFNLLLWMKDNETRHKYAFEKFEYGSTNKTVKSIDWIPFMKTNVSIPKLNELLQISVDAENRRKFLNDLVLTCKLNEDYNSLLEILKYFNMKHKNEQLSVRSSFIKNFVDTLDSNLSKLSRLHWEELYNIICNFDMKSELNHRFLNIPDMLFVEALKFSKNDKLFFKNWYSYFVKWVGFKFHWKFYTTLSQANNKTVLLLAAELTEPSFHEDLLKSYFDYNTANPKNIIIIVEQDWVLKFCDKKLTKTDKTHIYEMEETICLIENDNGLAEYFSDRLIELKKQILNICDDLDKLSYFVQYQSYEPNLIPDKITKFCDLFFSFLKDDTNSFYHKVDKLKMLKRIPGFEELLHKKCDEILKNKKTDELKEHALWILLPCMSGSQFYEIVESYYPEEKTASIGSVECQYKFMFQKKIASSLKYFKSNPETLVALKKFCYGDFLQLAVGSLNSVCLKIPCHKSKRFLENSFNAPISFKKHVVRLLLLIESKISIINLIKEIWLDNRSPIIRKVLLDIMLKYLVTDIDAHIWWELIEKFIQELNYKDKDVIESFSNLNGVPKEYLSHYCKAMWFKILQVENELPFFQEKRFQMLEGINKNINHMEKDFIEYLLEDNLFSIHIPEINSEKCLVTAIEYMLLHRSTEENIQEKIKFIVTKLKLSFNNQWDFYDENEQNYTLRNIISKFFKIFFFAIIKRNTQDKILINLIIENFVKFLKEVFSSSTYFNLYYIVFEFILIYFNTNKNLMELGKQIQKIIYTENERDPCMAPIQLIKNLEYFANLLLMENRNIIIADIVSGILSDPLDSEVCNLVACLFINEYNFIDKNKKNEFNKILLKLNNKRIKLYLNSYFK